jgi:hypothetical protein
MKISVMTMLSAVITGTMFGSVTAWLVISSDPAKLVADPPKQPPNKPFQLPGISISVKDLQQDKVNPLIRKSTDEESNYFIVIRPLNMKFYAEVANDGKETHIILIAMDDYPTFGLKAGDRVDAKDLWPKLHKFATTGNRFQGPG